ncbi:MAG: tetratricopeptide repeat protein [Gammaproteobacteria bacterium]|nr:tetratricopeptide repeat protein [Gammaproteobacteria bacterium]
MQSEILANVSWLALSLAFSLGVIISYWLPKKLGRPKKDKVNKDYFKGLNFLLNEETDKAIDSFIKALEVDNDTVELHLALGGLFRRKGQVDRATRLHQNLIARSNLTERQRFEAIYELAQDYYKAGWLDRAEGLFDELKSSATFRAAAINGLCDIYQREKEWQQAIDVLNQHTPSERTNYSKQISHYYCELAEIGLENLDYELASKLLKKASKEISSNPRVSVLQGELAFQQKNYLEALKQWLALSNSQSSLLQLVAGKVIYCFQQTGDKAGLKEFVLNLAAIPRHGHDFRSWYEALSDSLGTELAEEHILKRVELEGLSGPVANHLYHAVDRDLATDESKAQLLKELLGRAKSKKIEYTCSGCGFDTKAMYWYCQNCGEWDSFR